MRCALLSGVASRIREASYLNRRAAAVPGQGVVNHGSNPGIIMNTISRCPMTSGRFTTTMLVLTIAAALPVCAKPNFSGTWKLNTEKSSFGQMPAPESATYKVAHDEPKLKSSVTQAAQGNEF